MVKLKIAFLFISLAIWLVPVSTILALECNPPAIEGTITGPDGQPVATCVTPANAEANTSPALTQLDNPLGTGLTNPTQLYARIIYGFMGMTGVVALLMFVIGGFSWMTAGGNQEKVKKGKDTIIWAVLGLVIIFSSYAILRAVFETLKF